MNKGKVKLSFSGSYRWINCPGSAQLEAKYGVKKQTFEATEGTKAHLFAEQLLESETPASKIETILKGQPEELISAVKIYIETIENYRTPGSIGLAEFTASIRSLVEGLSDGTCDYALIGYRTAHLFDFKYGEGIAISPVGNTQLQLYALSILEKVDVIQHFVLHVVQPRMNNITSYEMTREELLEFSEQTNESAHQAHSPDAPRIPSTKTCQWCTAKLHCPEFVNQGYNALFQTDEQVPISFKTKLKLLEHAKDYRAKVKDEEKAVITQLSFGKEIDGIKLGEKYKFEWTVDARRTLEELYGDKVIKYKLIGITEVRKQLKDVDLTPYTKQSNGYTKLVVNDKKLKDEGRDPIATIKNKRIVSMLLKAVEDETLERLENGEKIEGVKSKKSRTVTQWNDKAKAFLISKLGYVAVKRKLITVAQAYKIVHKDDMQDLVEMVDDGVKLIVHNK